MVDSNSGASTPPLSLQVFSDEQLAYIQALISACGANPVAANHGSNAQLRSSSGKRGASATPGHPSIQNTLRGDSGSGSAASNASVTQVGGPNFAEIAGGPSAVPEIDGGDGTDEVFGSELEDGEAAGDSKFDPFTRGWHENNRGRRIAPRFVIPARFSPLYPVPFEPESFEHLRIFGAGNAGTGRAEEAAHLYRTAAYITVINNTLVEALQGLFSVDFPESVSRDIKRRFSETLDMISDVQVAVYGTYGLAASRYKVLCGQQGATGVADPDLLSAYVAPPAGYSSVGRQALRLQQYYAVKSTARQAGRRAAQRTSAKAKAPAQPRGGAAGSGGSGKRGTQGGQASGTKHGKSKKQDRR